MNTKQGILILGLLCMAWHGLAQSHLSKLISIEVKSQPIKDVLTIISNEADFNFSYNSKSVNKDSLVSLSIKNASVNQALRKIFNSNYEFKETGAYVIIRRRVISTSNVVAAKPAHAEYYYITGVVQDEETGERLADATVYEKVNLISTLTDHNGKFSMRLKNKYKTASLSFSKDGYSDTTLDIKSNFDQNMSIALSKLDPPYVAFGPPRPDDFIENTRQAPKQDIIQGESEFSVEHKWISRLLISSKQRIRSMNLKRFYTTRSYQFSIVPGLSSHGRMNPQVTNGVSINLLGGYSGGTNVFEVGTLFNIDKKHVKYGQVAGLFNLVGGNLNGIQVASIYNEVADTVHGTQVSGLVNKASEVKGIQVASLYNKAKSISGLQIGLINVTEGLQGTSIGLINISKGKRSKYKVGFILRLPRSQRI